MLLGLEELSDELLGEIDGVRESAELDALLESLLDELDKLERAEELLGLEVVVISPLEEEEVDIADAVSV